jgi:monofunctional biosynthetic peptidoglycan transglycosylase
MKKKKRKAKLRKNNTIWKKIKRILLYSFVFVVVGSATLVCLLRYIPPLTSAFMLHQHINDFQNDKGFINIKYQWVDHEQISDFAFTAVIAAEDQRFHQHSGFDLDAILTAVENHLDGDKLRGASTISQQVAKNLFLSPSRSFWRKGAEVWFTLLLELFWNKQRILEVYLNIAELGNHIFGIEAASQHFFGISAKNLSPQQAALMAATLPSPKRLRTDRPTSYLRKRQAWILGQMQNIRTHHGKPTDRKPHQ